MKIRILAALLLYSGCAYAEDIIRSGTPYFPLDLYLWLVVVAGSAFLALPGRRKLWILIAVLGYPVSYLFLNALAYSLGAETEEGLATVARAHFWMLYISWAYVAIWLLWQRLRNAFGKNDLSALPPCTTAIDIVVVLMVLPIFTEITDPMLYKTLGFFKGGGVIVDMGLWLLIIVAAAGIWQRRRWGWIVAVGTCVLWILLGFFLIFNMADKQGLIAAGHGGVSIWGLVRVAWLFMMTIGLRIIALSILLTPEVRACFGLHKDVSDRANDAAVRRKS